MSDNGTDGRGKHCTGGAGGKFVPRVWDCRTTGPHLTMLYIDIDHRNYDSKLFKLQAACEWFPLQSFRHFLTLFLGGQGTKVFDSGAPNIYRQRRAGKINAN